MTGIDRQLEKTESHEWQLWLLALGLLLVFVGTTVVTLLVGTIGLEQRVERLGNTLDRALWGLLALTALFCLYALHTRMRFRRMKLLLIEMNSLAASSKNIDDFLPSIAHGIADGCDAVTCRVALLEQSGLVLRIATSYASGEYRNRDVGKALRLDKLPRCRRVLDTSRPLILGQEELSGPGNDDDEQQLLTCGLKGLRSVLIVPMVTGERTMGIIVLGIKRGILHKGFSRAKVTVVRALAGHAASAVEQARRRKEATRDPLTDLYNRRHFSERMLEEIARASRDGSSFALLLCDLDRFKSINDLQGHRAGDEALRMVADAIRDATRGADLLFRWGGDEFAVVLLQTSKQGGVIVAQRIRKALRKRAAEVWPDLDISIGVALYPDHGRDEDELIQTADRALYGAKRGRKKIRVGEEDSRLGEHIFNIVFQPVVDVSSGEMLGYEALSRDPQGLISVADLFKQYAALGQLTELKQLIFKTQIERASGLGLKRLFINADFDMLGHLEPIARPGGLDVIIELSELEPLQNPENHLKVATAWREEGYRFAIDDFGAGYVSLPFIARLMPEYIKVDRGTILHAVDSDQFRRFLGRLLRAVETYASEGIIAEGIEQNTELQAVRELGISLVQGFLFGEPRPLDQQEAGAGLDRHVLTTH